MDARSIGAIALLTTVYALAFTLTQNAFLGALSGSVVVVLLASMAEKQKNDA